MLAAFYWITYIERTGIVVFAGGSAIFFVTTAAYAKIALALAVIGAGCPIILGIENRFLGTLAGFGVTGVLDADVSGRIAGYG